MIYIRKTSQIARFFDVNFIYFLRDVRYFYAIFQSELCHFRKRKRALILSVEQNYRRMSLPTNWIIMECCLWLRRE